MLEHRQRRFVQGALQGGRGSARARRGENKGCFFRRRRARKRIRAKKKSRVFFFERRPPRDGSRHRRVHDRGLPRRALRRRRVVSRDDAVGRLARRVHGDAASGRAGTPVRHSVLRVQRRVHGYCHRGLRRERLRVVRHGRASFKTAAAGAPAGPRRVRRRGRRRQRLGPRADGGPRRRVRGVARDTARRARAPRHGSAAHVPVRGARGRARARVGREGREAGV